MLVHVAPAHPNMPENLSHHDTVSRAIEVVKVFREDAACVTIAGTRGCHPTSEQYFAPQVPPLSRVSFFSYSLVTWVSKEEKRTAGSRHISGKVRFRFCS